MEPPEQNVTREVIRGTRVAYARAMFTRSFVLWIYSPWRRDAPASCGWLETHATELARDTVPGVLERKPSQVATAS